MESKTSVPGDAVEKRAKLFRNGKSQAVRLPKEFRFEGTEVRVRRAGRGILLEPVTEKPGTRDWDWVREWRDMYGPLDDDFVAAVQEKMPQQERPEVDRFFAEAAERHFAEQNERLGKGTG